MQLARVGHHMRQCGATGDDGASLPTISETDVSMQRRIVYLVTEDWYFLSHRLPMARAARDVGFDVHVATRLVDGRGAIEAEGFSAHPLSWRRGSTSPLANAMAIRELRRLFRDLQPAIVHNIAMKPTVLGSLSALRLRDTAVVNSIAGLGTLFLGQSTANRLLRTALEHTLSRLMNRPRTRVVVQNPDDQQRFVELGTKPSQIVLIPGSGVDTDLIRATREPPPPIKAAFVGRMLEDKGLRCLLRAHELLRTRGIELELILAGAPDPENSSSIGADELRTWSKLPGIEWRGHIDDIDALWREVHFAVLPSRREGMPLSLLEAASAGRAMVASDAPGCREIAREGETALTHRVDDARALAEALARMATDTELRLRLATRARQLVEERFSARAIGEQTVALYESLLTEST
ncbi:MAG: glycosyltransferase family 4 protein [Hyphomicrobiaceae bacterium]